MRKQYHCLSELLPQQKEAFKKMVLRRNILYMGKTGSGKTFTTLASFIHHFNQGNFDVLLVSTPLNAYVKKVWLKDVNRLTDLKAIDIEELYKKSGGDVEKLKHWIQEYPVVYMKHTHIYVYDDFITQLQKSFKTCVVVDEIHCLKTFRSRLRTYYNLIITNYSALYGLTATPISRNLQDFYSIMQFVKPWFLGSFDSFKKEYCKVSQQVIGRNGVGGLKKVDIIIGVSNAESLKRKIEPYVISQDSLMDLNFHYVDYELSPREQRIYRKLGKGTFASRFEEDLTAEDWFKRVMGESDDVNDVYLVKDNQRHSSRFLYLQFAADGIISDDGVIGKEPGTKLLKLLELCRSIAAKGQSAAIYFDYYASLNCFKDLMKRSGIKCKILENTGNSKFKETDINPNLVKLNPYFILSTKAGSASESLYYINNVIFAHVPTTPETFTQFSGRISRVNTLFPGDLHCYIMRSENIDLYKLCVISNKAAQSEVVAKEEKNIPPDYKGMYDSLDTVKMLKKYLLWDKSEQHRIL